MKNTNQSKVGILSLLFSFIPILLFFALVANIYNLNKIIPADIAQLLIVHSLWISISFGILGLFQKGKKIYSKVGLVISSIQLIAFTTIIIWAGNQNFS